jgi:pimeloyl-ACP methyl ester carboxylesterase
MNEALLLAHGAFHGPWCWHPTLTRLEEHGIRCVAVDLNRGGLEADRVALQGIVDSLREEGCRVHAIGHSLGCCSVALLDPQTIASATLLAGPIEGEGLPSSVECTVPEFVQKLLPQEDGRVFLSREDARALFYHRCRDAEAEWALDRLRPTYVYGGQASTPPLWESIPVTYVECTDDRAVRPEYQRAVAERCSFSARLDSDHSPMLGQPEALCEIVLEAMGRAC